MNVGYSVRNNMNYSFKIFVVTSQETASKSYAFWSFEIELLKEGFLFKGFEYGEAINRDIDY